VKAKLTRKVSKFSVYQAGALHATRTDSYFGVTNEIKAVVRTVGLGETVGWEWIVVHEQDDKNFSQPGDSGACVFDMNGEVVGLVTSGRVAEKVLRWWDSSGADLTFVAPIDQVLEDIEKVTGCKPSLA
jgi:hypothetical protein